MPNKTKDNKKLRVALALDRDVIQSIDQYQKDLFLPSRSYTVNIILRNHLARVQQEVTANAKN